MPPNPIFARHRPTLSHQSDQPTTRRPLGSTPIIFLSTVLGIAALAPAATRQWLYSGAVLESLLIIYSDTQRSSNDVHAARLWIVLAAVNITYLIASTSWLLRASFVGTCYSVIFATCISEFLIVSRAARSTIRRILPGVHFLGDKIAYFNLPALEIDAEAYGLLVARGITFSLSTLEIEVHGLELGLRISNEYELAMCADRLSISLFKSIEVSDIYGNIKVDEGQMLFNDPVNSARSPIRKQHRAQNGNEAAVRPKRVDSADVEGYSSSAHLPRSIAKNDTDAETGYNDAIQSIKSSSQVCVARQSIEGNEHAKPPEDEREMRQAICARLQSVPAISHTPEHAITVSWLQNIFPRTRRFLHRLPLLLRLLLNPLSYLHPIEIPSISIAGPGDKLKQVIKQRLFENQESLDANMEQLEEELSVWLSDASFCLEVSDLSGLTHVPLNSAGDILAYLQSGNIAIYRTPNDTNEVTQVTHIGGTDATCVIPAFLLPHHEHCWPPPPHEQSSSKPGTTNMDSTVSDEANEENQDVANIIFSVHASLPSHFDQSLLDFAAALLKATDVMNVETLFEPGEPDEDGNTSLRARISERIPNSLKTGIKKGVKADAVKDKVNDRWVARTVGKLAAKLESAHGDFGYTSTFPLSLESYRHQAETASKILP